MVIIQNDVGNRHSPTTIVAAISTQIKTKANLPTHYHLKPGSGLVQPSMAVSEKKLKRDAEKERENAAICLFCVKEECSGADACFREQKKKRQRQYQADRRNAQQSLDAFYHAQQAKENRRRKIEAQAAFQKRKEAE